MRRALEIALLAAAAAQGWDMTVLAVRALSSWRGVNLSAVDELEAPRVLLEWL